MAKEKVEYTLPADKVDLEARLDRENDSPMKLSTAPGQEGKSTQGSAQIDPDDTGREYALEGNDLSAYQGTDPMYAHYSDDVFKPYRAEGDGPEARLEASVLDSDDDEDEETPQPQAGPAQKSSAPPKSSDSSDK
jgi:hypothetical protein